MKIAVCNCCGKTFDDNDYVNGGQITDNLSGMDDFDLCATCYNKIMNVIIPHCKVKPFLGEWENGEDENCDEDGV